jgi:hypothetical protein
MILKNHIVYKVLTDGTIALKFAEHMYPEYYRDWINSTRGHHVEGFSKIKTFFELMNADYNRSFIITESVHKNLELLKIDKLDWTVFLKIPDGKRTLISPHNNFTRFYKRNGKIEFCYCAKRDAEEGMIDLVFTALYVDLETGDVTMPDAHINKNMNVNDLTILYKLLCFLYLTNNEEVVIPPGKTHGTRKTGKMLNDTPFPVTIVTSKWNITSIRNEGFAVSGHFRLQPCGTGRGNVKLVFIEPFTKNGYKRTAAKLTAS